MSIYISSIAAGGILIQVLVTNIRIVRNVQKLFLVKFKLASLTLEVRCYIIGLNYTSSISIFIIHVGIVQGGSELVPAMTITESVPFTAPKHEQQIF